MAGTPCDGSEDRGGNRDDQRTGAGHDEQRHGPVKCRKASLSIREGRDPVAEPPDEKHEGREPEDTDRVACTKAVGKALAGCLEVLRFLDKADDFLQGALTSRLGRFELHRAPEIDRAAIDRVALELSHGIGLAGQIRLVGGGFALDHFGVDRKLTARLNRKHIAHLDLRHGHLTLVARCIHQERGLGRGVEEAVDLPPRAMQGKMLQGTGEGEQEKK